MNPLPLLELLLDRPSVSPDDAGCMDILSKALEKMGFDCKHLPSGPVNNLWARLGTTAPLVVFAGHTDVVPAGSLSAWLHSPFMLTQDGDKVYGRGTQDMKGGLACMVAACEDFLDKHPVFNGSIGFLLTSGEEGDDYLHGTPKVLEYLNKTGQIIDYCIVGEPSCKAKIGDTLRIGRRGSLHGQLTVKGEQGHVAYPNDATNAIHEALGALDALSKLTLDEGHEHFPASTLQISNIHGGTGAKNVIPGEVQIDFNIRYNPNLTHESIAEKTESLFNAHHLDYELAWTLSGEPFITEPGTLINTLTQIIHAKTGLTPTLCTGGGTSDARFIAKTGCEVIEFGLVNDRIHQVNEYTTVPDLKLYTEILSEALTMLLATHN